MVVPGRHDRHARHHRRRRRPLVVDPRARRQDGRHPGLHQQDLVQGHRRSGSRTPRPVRRAVRAQPRQHDRARDRRAVRRLQGLVRPPGGGHQGRPRRGRQAARRDQQAASRSDRRPRRKPPQTPWPSTIRHRDDDRAPRAWRGPQIIAHEARPERTGLDVVDHHDRPQEDRDHVPLHGPRLLPAGRRRGAADADPARRAGQHVPDAREVQPDLHDARDDDDLPGRRPGVGGLRELPAAADDRRARRRLPAPERVVVLDVPVRRHRALRVGLLHAARGRLVLLRAALVQGVLARPAARTRGSTWSTSPACRRSSARSTSSPRSTTCARPAWAGAACRCSCGRS